MKLKPGSYFIILVMAVSLAVILGALSLEFKSIRVLPMVIGGIVFSLAAISLVRDLLSKKETRGPEEEKSLRTYWPTAAWIASFALAIYLLGFLIAIPLFILSYLKSKGRGWLGCIIVAGITTGLIYLAFEFALQVKLYRGLLFSW
jgi:small-conductance mechanosensitive channel